MDETHINEKNDSN